MTEKEHDRIMRLWDVFKTAIEAEAKASIKLLHERLDIAEKQMDEEMCLMKKDT